jgi:hypothetical protein
MAREEPSSTSAKILYRPVGLTASIIAGVISGQIVKQLWKHATPGDNADAPQALQSEYRMRDIVLAAALQGAVFAMVKAVVDRAGARAFQRWTGEWPGD